jgi:hypothetical protein
MVIKLELLTTTTVELCAATIRTNKSGDVTPKQLHASCRSLTILVCGRQDTSDRALRVLLSRCAVIITRCDSKEIHVLLFKSTKRDEVALYKDAEYIGCAAVSNLYTSCAFEVHVEQSVLRCCVVACEEGSAEAAPSVEAAERSPEIQSVGSAVREKNRCET